MTISKKMSAAPYQREANLNFFSPTIGARYRR